MTAAQKVVRRKLSLLELAQNLNNVSKACQVITIAVHTLYGQDALHPPVGDLDTALGSRNIIRLRV